MGYAAYLAWKTGMSSVNPATRSLTEQGATLYTIQLGLNLVWMPLFFKYKMPVAATVDIVALTGVTGYLTYLWGQVDERAGYFLAPYLTWLGFATYLCVRRRPSRLRNQILTSRQAGAGYLNNWNFDDKIAPAPPSSKQKRTKFVDERP